MIVLEPNTIGLGVAPFGANPVLAGDASVVIFLGVVAGAEDGTTAVTREVDRGELVVVVVAFGERAEAAAAPPWYDADCTTVALVVTDEKAKKPGEPVRH